jgi:hypothetical protein
VRKTSYAFLASNATFWLIVAGVFLCNLPQTLNSMQLKLMLLDNGASSADASIMISVFAVGAIFGRFACGIALDRLPPHLVATVGMGLPSIGMFIIASSIDTPFALFTLDWTNNYALFVLFGAIVTVVGSSLFMLLGREPAVQLATQSQLRTAIAPAKQF